MTVLKSVGTYQIDRIINGTETSDIHCRPEYKPCASAEYTHLTFLLNKWVSNLGIFLQNRIPLTDQVPIESVFSQPH